MFVSKPPRVLRALAFAFAVCALSSAATAAPGADRSGATPTRYGRAAGARYVALGDSEAAAPGVPVQVDAHCGRSSHDYPSVVAQRLGTASFTDATCSGATTAGLARGQFRALRADTTLVTLTIGANDIGFTGVTLRCSALGLLDADGAPCRHVYGDRLDRRITGIEPKVAAAVGTVHRLAPHARVLLVGYLNLLPDDHRGCRPRELFGAGDVAWLDDAEDTLDATLAAAAREAGAVFVDEHPGSAAHDVCRLPGVRWTEGIRPTSAAIPFHPNAAGESAMADAVLTALGPAA